MTEVKDQAQETEQSETKVEETKVEEEKQPETAQETYDAGFEKYGDEIAGEEEVVPPKKVEKKEEEECIGCGKDASELTDDASKIDWDKVKYSGPDWPKPYKVQGKVEWVKNEEERTAFLQQTVDHTKKYQDLSEERKGFQAEKEKTETELEGVAKEFREGVASLNELAKFIYKDPSVQAAVKEQEKGAGTRELTENEILADAGIDPDDLTVDDLTKKQALKIYAQDKKLEKLEGKMSAGDERTNFMFWKDFSQGILGVAAEAKKKYPYEEVMGTDKDGKPQNKTALYFATEMVKRVQEQEVKPEKERISAGDLTWGLVKEIHEMQKGPTSSKEGSLDLSGLTLEEINAQIKEKRPELFSEEAGGNDKGKESETDQSSTDETTKKRKSAPSLRTENREKVDIQHFIKSKGEGQPRFMTPEEGMKAAFDDGEIDFDED